MIEQFKNIDFFKPNVFEILAQDNVKMMNFLQDFTDFLCKKCKLDNYEIIFDHIHTDSYGEFDHTNKQIILNKKYFEQYKNYISKGIYNDFTQLYSIEVLGSIRHEVEHIVQYELERDLKAGIYDTIDNTFINDPLYILQKTERDAFFKTFDELTLLKSVFDNNTNSLIDKYINQEKHFVETLFDNSINDLYKRDILDNSDINDEINIYNIESKLNTYSKIKSFIKYELPFLKDYQDHIKNDHSYITKNITTYDNRQLECRYRNIDGVLNVRLRINSDEIYFALDGDLCRVSQFCHYNANYNPEHGVREVNDTGKGYLFKYMNAFINLYNPGIDKIIFSDLIFDTKTLDNISMKPHLKGIKKKFKFKIKDLKKVDYEKASNEIYNNLTLDDIITVTTVKHNKIHSLNIER